MLYGDLLYGRMEIPDFIKEFFWSREVLRLRDISLSVLPQRLTLHGPMPNRFQHSVGVMRLAMAVCERKEFRHLKELLLLSSLLHDAGNSPFSHLSEYFQKETFGKDGESFLEIVLEGSETENLLKRRGIDTKLIVDFVTGNAKPFSDILNGSIDIDNLDNVARYGKSIGLFDNPYDIISIARAFGFDGDKIILENKISPEIEKWKKTRKRVYNLIYSEPHLTSAMMVYRAVEIAFTDGDINKDFFFLNDSKAIDFLASGRNKKTGYLMEKSLRWQWYDYVFGLATTKPSDKLKEYSGNWKGRKIFADALAAKLKIPDEKVCVYIGKGKEVRDIHLSFADASIPSNPQKEKPIYRVKVYIDPSLLCLSLKRKITDITLEEFV